MTDNAGNFDLFDPTLLPERVVTIEEVRSVFGLSTTAGLDKAIAAGRVPVAAGKMARSRIWYVGQLREWFRVRCAVATRSSIKNAKTAI